MVDVVSKKTRSRMMSSITGKNTKPELIVRKGLHARGFRYSLHPRRLAGKPDIFLKKYKVAVFVHGCFWHAHDCRLFKLPQTRTSFWEEKFSQNQVRDRSSQRALLDGGYRVCLIWECALKGKRIDYLERVFDLLESWIKVDGEDGETLFIEVSEKSMGQVND